MRLPFQVLPMLAGNIGWRSGRTGDGITSIFRKPRWRHLARLPRIGCAQLARARRCYRLQSKHHSPS